MIDPTVADISTPAAVAIGICPGAIGCGQCIGHGGNAADAGHRTVHRRGVGHLGVGRSGSLATAMAIIGRDHHAQVFVRIAGGQRIAGAGGTSNLVQIGAAVVVGPVPLVAVGEGVAIGDSDNEASIALHRRYGFQWVGVLPAVGFKFGRWVDSVLLQRALGREDDGVADSGSLSQDLPFR